MTGGVSRAGRSVWQNRRYEIRNADVVILATPSQTLRGNLTEWAPSIEQDAVQRMLQQGGEKPTATEYMLQQVIFVVPASERKASLAKRKREAEAMRARSMTGASTILPSN